MVGVLGDLVTWIAVWLWLWNWTMRRQKTRKDSRSSTGASVIWRVEEVTSAIEMWGRYGEWDCWMRSVCSVPWLWLGFPHVLWVAEFFYLRDVCYLEDLLRLSVLVFKGWWMLLGLRKLILYISVHIASEPLIIMNLVFYVSCNSQISPAYLCVKFLISARKENRGLLLFVTRYIRLAAEGGLL